MFDLDSKNINCHYRTLKMSIDIQFSVPPRLCPHDCDHMTVCAHTRLYPDTFVPTHVCAQSWFYPHDLAVYDCA